MEANERRVRSRTEKVFDSIGFVGLLLAVPTALFICGMPGPANFLSGSLGAFGAPASLLLAFVALTFLRMLFGSSRRALPVVMGLAVGLLCFASVFDLPGLAGIRGAAARFPAFGEPGPAFFAGLAAILSGSIAGQFESGKASFKFFLPPVAALACLLVLAGLKPFPAVATERLSVDSALKAITQTLGYEYRDPEVEKAVRKVVEDKDKTIAEKEALIAELTARLKKAEDDRAALEQSSGDAKRLGEELDAAKKAIADLKGRVEDSTPLLAGGSYEKAVQPMDPLVRDFAVKLASGHPGAFDNPQGSFHPTVEGLRQVALVHGAISSSWKYVSDPGVSWADYVSPARRTLAIGLTGDCDDFAVMVASCVEAIGGKARIVIGSNDSEAHAWAELWLGSGGAAQSALATMGDIVGRGAQYLATDRDPDGTIWLILDWRIGQMTIKVNRVRVAWGGS